MHGRNVENPTYGLVGSQFGESAQEATNSKRPTSNSPIIITSANPGTMLNDDAFWSSTYASSYDSHLTIVNGAKLQETIDNISIDGIYKNGLVNADDDNLWKSADGVQQIQYIASKTDVDSASSAVDSFGEVSEARGIGIRIPGIAGGWGKTIDLLPTDPEPTEDEEGRKNDEAHKLARETWKYGILDARWDYRKGVWATYNDLISDKYENGLGTWVFGTNPDTAEGFPFLRGKLDDVWWVRQPVDLDGTDGKSQGVQTGRVMTHLKHEWFDENENGSARLESIFIIPHTVSNNACHDKGAENILGSEITGDSVIDIKTSVHFFKDTDNDGSILFGRNANDIDLCCNIDDESKWFLGEMVFVPKNFKTNNCPDTNNPEECVWQPAIQIDECQLVGGHFLDLVTNDQSLALMVCSLCDEIKSWSQSVTSVIASNDAILEDRISKTQNALVKAVKDLSECIVKALSSANANTQFIAEQQSEIINQLVCAIYGDIQIIDGQIFEIPGLTNQINDVLFECIGKAPSLTETEVRDANGLAPGQTQTADGVTVEFNWETANVVKGFVEALPGNVFSPVPFDCPVTVDFGSTAHLDTPDAFTNCPDVTLNFPCGSPETFIVNCNSPVPQTLSTDYGDCQTRS